ncbi:hypothetical protein K8R47_04205 [archaeon]|nr:hypothetical protein [archaeon]
MELFQGNLEEKEIHRFIIEAYENKGYDCINFHKSGACVEGGVDLFTNKDKEKIIIAVKIKPKKEDISQLNKFIKNKEINKIYVYIKDPTRPFFDYIKNLNSSKFINANSLHDFLIENKSILYLRKYFFSHDLFNNLTEIIKIWFSVKDIKTMYPTEEDLKLMWGWKDKAVSFHKISKALFDYKDSKIKSISYEQDYKKLVEDILSILNYLNRELEQFKDIFVHVKRTNPGLLSKMWEICEPRSNWCNLLCRLEGYKEVQIGEIFFDYFFKGTSTKEPYTFLSDILQGISVLADDMEKAIDWLFEGYKNGKE